MRYNGREYRRQQLRKLTSARIGVVLFFAIYILHGTQGDHNFRKLVTFGIRGEENAFARGPDPRRRYREYFNTYILSSQILRTYRLGIACVYSRS